MVNKIKVRRRKNQSVPSDDSNGYFTVCAVSASVIAFFLGVALAFLEPPGVHSQTNKVLSKSSVEEEPPVLHLKREFIYLGSKLIAIDEAGSTFAVPDEPMVWSPKSGVWKGLGDNELSPSVIRFGKSGDEPFLADFDGDGLADPVILERTTGKWTIRNSFGGLFTEFRFGFPAHVFSIADFDGDGKADIASFDPSSGLWAIRYTADSKIAQVEFGTVGDVPCVTDFDGDGRADLGIWRSSDSSLHQLNNSDGKRVTVKLERWAGDPFCADFDGDGRGDIAFKIGDELVVRSGGFGTIALVGRKGQLGNPVIADFDGDGRADFATWNPETGSWQVLESKSGALKTFKHGQKGDRPLAGIFRR
jgi:hypothetical protein